MQPYPRSPDLVWPGHLHGRGCLSARAMDTGLPTVAWRLRLGLGCGWVRVSAASQHSWLGCWGLCVLVCLFRLYPATPGWGVRRGCVCLGSGFGCVPPLLAWVLGCVCACVRAPFAPRHSWLGCVVRVCVLRLGFRLHAATPGWGVGVCVCLCACSGCTPPLLAGVCGVGVVLGLGGRLCPATPGWGVGVCVCLCARPACTPPLPGWGVRCGRGCLGSGFGCGPPLLAGVMGCARLCACSPCTPPLLAGVCGVDVGAWARVSAAPRHSWLGCWVVRVCVRAPLVPRHSWLGCAVRVCVFGLGFRLRPATPGWGVGVCVWWCGRFPCTLPLLAGMCGAGVGVWARVSAALRHSWLVVGVCVWWCGRKMSLISALDILMKSCRF